MIVTQAQDGRGDNNGSREDQDINGSKEAQDNNRSNTDQDNNGSNKDQDINGSIEEQDNNRSSENQDNNGSNEGHDINGSSENQDNNAPLNENSLIHYFYQNAFFTNKMLCTIVQNQCEIIKNLGNWRQISGFGNNGNAERHCCCGIVGRSVNLGTVA